MSDSLTTTVFLRTTVTSTKTLTRTILSLTSIPSAATTSHRLNPIHIPDTNEQPIQCLYPYNPSLVLGLIFVILYSMLAISHGYLSLYAPTRPETQDKHRYTIPLFIASLFSTLGYLLRCISMQKKFCSNIVLYTISTALIIVSPIFICATLYLILTRLITRCLPTAPTIATPTTTSQYTNLKSTTASLQKFLYLRPTHLCMLFITSDVLSFLTQSLGPALASSNHWRDPELTRGTRILLTGLALQLTTFIIYLVTLHLFCLRVRNSPAHGFNPCIMKVVIATWIASGFVLVRMVFRLVEFAMGSEGYPFLHEWCLYVFEAFPIWVALAVMGWWHPVKWIQERVLGENAATAGGGMQGMSKGGEVVVKAPVVGGHGSRATEGEGHMRKRSRGGFGFGF